MEIQKIVEWVIVGGIVLLWNGYLIYKMKKMNNRMDRDWKSRDEYERKRIETKHKTPINESKYRIVDDAGVDIETGKFVG